jgi:dipeptidyl aminopeptidase/acylaminoacyl peptidase
MRAQSALHIMVVALVFAGVFGCTQQQQSVELIPLEVLFGNPTQVQARLAPDGSTLSYVAPYDGVLNLWIRGENGEQDEVLTIDEDRGIKHHSWLFDSENILFLQDEDGDENWRLYIVNVETGKERLLTPDDESVDHPVRAELLALHEESPNIVMIGMNKRDERIRDAYRLDTTTGQMQLVEEGNVSLVRWVIDENMDVRGWVRANPEGGSTLLLRDSGSGPFEEHITWAQEDELGSRPIAFAQDHRNLYLLSSKDRNSSALYSYDTLDRELTLLAEDPIYDVSKFLYSPLEKTPQAALVVRERKEWIVLDPELEKDFALIAENARGDFYVTSRTYDDRKWVIFYGVDNASGAYYLYDRDAETFEKLFDTIPELANHPLVTMDPISFTARDGLELHGYLTLPEYVTQPMPLVLYVHGGPWTRDYWGFNETAQWLANRGYACLQVNFRGSTGYGKEFLNAGDREWGGKIQDDLTDAVNWVIEQGIADPDRVAIFGASFGGYAALAGAAFTPDLYSCAVSIVGPSSLVTMLSSIPPYWSSYQQVFDTRTGRLPRYETGNLAGLPKSDSDFTDQDRADIEFLRSRSPLYSADAIHIPMLIGQGANDVRVKQAESEQVVKALTARGIEVEYAFYPDEGHGLSKPENRIDFYRRADAFLARILGGRAEE